MGYQKITHSIHTKCRMWSIQSIDHILCRCDASLNLILSNWTGSNTESKVWDYIQLSRQMSKVYLLTLRALLSSIDYANNIIWFCNFLPKLSPRFILTIKGVSPSIWCIFIDCLIHDLRMGHYCMRMWCRVVYERRFLTKLKKFIWKYASSLVESS